MEHLSTLCDSLRATGSHTNRSKLIADFLRNLDGSQNDIYILFRLLLPKETKLVYKLKDKQLINLFSQLFEADKDAMLKHLEQAEDAATTIGTFFAKSDAISPASNSSLSLTEVDRFLQDLASATKDVDRLPLLKKIVKQCTVKDLVLLVRIVRQDLRINAGCKQILDGLHPQAYGAFQASRDLKAVINKVLTPTGTTSNTQTIGAKKPSMIRSVSTGIRLMTPMKPMLAEACRSAAQAFAKVEPGGELFAEIKYDGERVQIHKDGDKFAFFSRSLKAVPTNKVSHVEPYIPKAFARAKQLVIDCEILLLDTKTNRPLPFGSLGVHKRAAFKDATVCIFVFDCLYLNGESLIHKPISSRRSVLEQYFCEVPHRVLLSERHVIQDIPSLNILMARVFSENLEGLVLKPSHSTYEPGKRHWLKIKRDYLAEGSMADSVDLIVLGAYYGTGNKAGLMSVFLMGAYDPASKQFTTVTKCGNGFTDEMLQTLQNKLKMRRITQSDVPSWLNVAKSLIPDFIVEDPKSAPVWEITGAEFSRASTHTAGLSSGETQGISIRFPRFTKARPDKTWKQATNVSELQRLVAESGKRSDWLDILNDASDGCAIRKNTGKRVAMSGSRSNLDPKPRKLPRKEGTDTTKYSKIKPCHLRPLFNGMVFQVAENTDFDQMELNATLRLLVAGGAELKGAVGSSFASLLSNDEATHLLVPSNGNHTPSSLIQVTPDKVKKSLSAGRLLL
ncbi:hypothetical protein CRM22_007536 [Opisthorchis felineus]|uniref:DNA ligase n=1 Tax=Opisthorchis felineus TaxID=147828 RepID=A0A4S2LN99_OPIFE|nr:hypothetical protein CRM22_007536 [Opisthorchis felineus]